MPTHRLSDTSAHGARIPPVDNPPAPEAEHTLSPARRRYFLVVFLLSFLALGWLLQPFWQLLILSFLLTGIFRPVYLYLLRYVSSWMASGLTCLLITLILFIPLIFCIVALSSEALTFLSSGMDANLLVKVQTFIRETVLAPGIQEQLTGYGIHIKPEDITTLLSDASRRAGIMIYSQVSSLAANIMSFIVKFCILIMVVSFLLIDMDRLVAFLIRLSPMPDDQDQLLMKKFQDIAGAILVGNGVCGVIQGVLGGAYFAMLGLNSPVLWGTIMGILAFLPIFGIGLVLIPTAALFLLNGWIAKAVMTLIFYAILSWGVEYLFKPKFVGSQVKMHTMLVLLAILGGMAVFGLLGIIYGPLIVTAFLTLAEMYLLHYQETDETVQTATSESSL